MLANGLGKSLAQQYFSRGKTVVNVSRRKSKYAQHNIAADLRHGAAIKKAANQILKIKEPLEAIVNAAGVLSVQPLGNISEDEIKRTMATNVKAPILLVSNLIAKIKKDGTDIVNVSSTVGTKGYINQAIYGASKWAVRGLSANLQAELANYPCRVISFCPGGFKSGLFKKATGTDNTKDGSEWMSPDELARFIIQILELPKNMEVSEVIVNRRQVLS